MIKVDKHLLTCACADCLAMFPSDRFEPVWAAAEPDGPARRALGTIPLGAPNAPVEVVLFVDAAGRLATDWPGFPGTAGARVELTERGPGQAPMVTGTRDPILGALAPGIPLRRRVAARMNARSMVEHGLAPLDSADFVTCGVHGEALSALTCAHIAQASAPLEVVVVYSPDGDFPDIFCAPCLEDVARGALDLTVTVCSRCQQLNAYRHEVTATTWYGQRPDTASAR